MKQIPCCTWGTLERNVEFHLQTVQCTGRTWLATVSGDALWCNEMKSSHVLQQASPTQSTFMEIISLLKDRNQPGKRDPSELQQHGVRGKENPKVVKTLYLASLGLWWALFQLSGNVGQCVLPSFAFFWTQWLSVQVIQDLQKRTLNYLC